MPRSWKFHVLAARPIASPGLTEDARRPHVALSRSRRLSVAEKPLPDLRGALRRFGIWAQRCRDLQEEFRAVKVFRVDLPPDPMRRSGQAGATSNPLSPLARQSHRDNDPKSGS